MLVPKNILHADDGKDHTSNVPMPSKVRKTVSDVVTAKIPASMKLSSRKEDDRHIHNDDEDAVV